MKQDLALQLTTLETKRKRWQTRLRRAVTELDKIERKRKRLLTPAKIGQPKLAKDLTEVIVTSPLPDLVQSIDDRLTAIIEDRPEQKVVDEIPAFIDRRDPKVRAELEEARAKAKTKMPLTDKAAMDFIRKKSAQIEKKRAKRDSAFFKNA